MNKEDKIVIAEAINSLITERMLNHREHHIVKFPFIGQFGRVAFFLYNPDKRRITAIEYRMKGKTRKIKLKYNKLKIKWI